MVRMANRTFTPKTAGMVVFWLCVSLACAHHVISATGKGSPGIWRWDSEAYLAAIFGSAGAMGAAIGTFPRRRFAFALACVGLMAAFLALTTLGGFP